MIPFFAPSVDSFAVAFKPVAATGAFRKGTATAG